jgi:hypothetical protein
MRKIYVDVTAKLLLKVDDDADYDEVAGEIEDNLTTALDYPEVSTWAQTCTSRCIGSCALASCSHR